MKYIRWFARTVLCALVFAILVAVVQHLSGEVIPRWFMFLVGCITVFAFWED